jgi:hypothetical protein
MDRYEEAAREFEAIVDKIPVSEQLTMKIQLAICYEQLQKFHEALNILQVQRFHLFYLS